MAAKGGHTNFMFHDLPMQVARSATRVFHKLPQYKNANIANFILAVPLERNWTNEVYNLEI